jgi:hypothetical protein
LQAIFAQSILPAEVADGALGQAQLPGNGGISLTGTPETGNPVFLFSCHIEVSSNFLDFTLYVHFRGIFKELPINNCIDFSVEPSITSLFLTKQITLGISC